LDSTHWEVWGNGSGTVGRKWRKVPHLIGSRGKTAIFYLFSLIFYRCLRAVD